MLRSCWFGMWMKSKLDKLWSRVGCSIVASQDACYPGKSGFSGQPGIELPGQMGIECQPTTTKKAAERINNKISRKSWTSVIKC